MTVLFEYQDIKEVFDEPTPEALLSRCKQEAAKRAPLLMRGVVKAMPDMTFAAEVVKRVNGHFGRQDPPPASAQAFLDWAIERGYVKILKQ